MSSIFSVTLTSILNFTYWVQYLQYNSNTSITIHAIRIFNYVERIGSHTGRNHIIHQPKAVCINFQTDPRQDRLDLPPRLPKTKQVQASEAYLVYKPLLSSEILGLHEKSPCTTDWLAAYYVAAEVYLVVSHSLMRARQMWLRPCARCRCAKGSGLDLRTRMRKP